MNRAVDLAALEACLRARLPRVVLGHRRITIAPCTLRCVLVLLVYRAGETLSLAAIAEDLDISPNSAWRAVKVLEDAGLVRDLTGGLWERRGDCRGRRLVVDRDRLMELGGRRLAVVA